MRLSARKEGYFQSPAEEQDWDSKHKNLKFIYATKEVLRKNGFPTTKRLLSWPLKVKVEQFKSLVESEPLLYGSFGTENWVRSLLSYLNEPTYLAWEDVVDWLENPDTLQFLLAPRFVSTPGKIRLSPIKRASSNETNLFQPEKKPRLKFGIVKLGKCDEMSEQKQNPPEAKSTVASAKPVDESVCKPKKKVDITLFRQLNLGTVDQTVWSSDEETSFETASEIRGLNLLHEKTIGSLGMQHRHPPPAPGTYDVVLTDKSHFAVTNRNEIRHDPTHHLDYNCILRADLVQKFGDQSFS